MTAEVGVLTILGTMQLQQTMLDPDVAHPSGIMRIDRSIRIAIEARRQKLCEIHAR